MKKIIFITILTLSGLHSTWAIDYSKIGIELQKEMIFQPKEGKIPISIILNAQYDHLELKNNAKHLKNKEEKRKFVVAELKYFSSKTQKELIEILTVLSESETISNMQSFWISNSISCVATIEVIEELSSHPSILMIGLDMKQNLLPEYETPTPTPASPSRELTYNILKVQANEVWDLGITGEGIVVGVLDSGVNYNHEDLQGNMWEHLDFPYHGYNFISNNNNPIDDHGHGSHCAGTIAGNGASGSQTGIAPNAKIMAIKVLDSGGYGSISSIINGIEFAVENGAHILSMSLGFSGGGSLDQRFLLRTAMVNLLEAGIIASVAAGNDGGQGSPPPNNIGLPGSCPPPWLHPDQTLIGGLSAVVCVGSTNANDIIAASSSRGPVTWQAVTGFTDYPYIPYMGLIRPDVVAPGVEIKSLTHDNNTGYTNKSGTSMATPCVAGIMALLLQASPNLTPADICEILQMTALPLSDTKNNTYGAGRVNALDAINSLSFISASIESVIINDENENNNGLLNPDETVFLTISLKNKKADVLNNLIATLSSDNDMVIINNGYAVIESWDEFETITIHNAFSISLSENAVAEQEIEFKLNINSEDKHCELKFKIIVYDHIFELFNIVIPQEEPLIPGQTSDLFIYLKNTGNGDTFGVKGTLISNSTFLIINENEQFYGNLYHDQYKYRTFNITVLPSAPPILTKFNVTMFVTDEYEKNKDFNFQIDINNVNSQSNDCVAINYISTEIIDTSLKLTWEEPEGGIVEKYVIYCNNIFLTETESTFYIYEDIKPGIYNFCLEVLYSNGCTSSLYCTEFISPCIVSLFLSAEIISDNEILLQWQSDIDDVTYNIYRNSEFLTQVSDCYYIDSDVELETNYCYTITAICNESIESEHSNEECLIFSDIINTIENRTIIYPNPFKNQIVIVRNEKWGVEEGELSIKIFNAMGLTVKDIKFDGKAINTGNLDSGIYFLIIEGYNGEKSIHKIVKK